MMPLMYVILKDARADIEEASRRIEEATDIVNQSISKHLRDTSQLLHNYYYNYYTTAALANGTPTYMPYNAGIHLGGNGLLTSHLSHLTTTIRPLTQELPPLSRTPPSPSKPSRPSSSLGEPAAATATAAAAAAAAAT